MALNAPILRSPAEGATGLDVSTTFEWTDVDNEKGYTIRFSTTDRKPFEDYTSGSTSADDVTYTSSGTQLGYGDTYYWRVRAWNYGSTSDWSSTGSFSTKIVPVVNPTPSDEATNIPTDATLQWDSRPGAELYRVKVSLYSGMSSPVINEVVDGSTTQYQITSALDPDTDYYWTVEASYPDGSEVSNTWTFHTASPPPPPSLNDPRDNATEVQLPVSLDWSDVSGASDYEVHIAESLTFDFPAVEATTGGSSSYSTSNLSYETTYYWRVRSISSAGPGDWSSKRTFKTSSQPPGTPNVRGPGKGENGVGVHALLEWTSASRADRYKVRLMRDGSVVRRATVYVPRHVAGDLDPGGRYTWQVRAENDGGSSAWTSERTFYTESGGPNGRAYFYVDHLGSVRATYDPDGSGSMADKIIEARDYYPFGLAMSGRRYQRQDTRTDFTGHEIDTETGLHYAGARYYMSALGRWTATDPYADKYPKMSPYQYAGNNPMRLTDPGGKFVVGRTDGMITAGRQYDALTYTFSVLNFLPISNLGAKSVFAASQDPSVEVSKTAWATSVVSGAMSAGGWDKLAQKIGSNVVSKMKSAAGGASTAYSVSSTMSRVKETALDRVAFDTIQELKLKVDGHQLAKKLTPSGSVMKLNWDLKAEWGGGPEAVARFEREIQKVKSVAKGILKSLFDGSVRENEDKILELTKKWFRALEEAKED